MRKSKNSDNSQTVKVIRPGLTPESRQDQLISLATDAAEQQLLNGTASSQVIVHYLRLAATKEKAKLENEILEKKKELIAAKTQELESAQKIEELYSEAIKAFKHYNGSEEDEE